MKRISGNTLMMCPRCGNIERKNQRGMHICTLCEFEWNYSTYVRAITSSNLKKSSYSFSSKHTSIGKNSLRSRHT